MREFAIRYWLVVLSIFVLIGCSSTRNFKADFLARRVTITSEPTGADVYQKWPLGQPSKFLGKTPLQNASVMVLRPTELNNMPYSDVQQLMSYTNNFVFRVTKEGYKPYSGLLGTFEEQTVQYNVILEKEEESTSD
ncbi:hypothetical protein ACFLZ8_00885 [Planctomycetota bacterium]